MSVEATAWALNVPVGGNTKVVLLGLANHAHPDGRESYPALDTLARYAHCNRSTARRNVRRLAAEGWIEEYGKGPQGQAKYRLLMDRDPGADTDPTGGVLPPVANRDGVALATEGGGTENRGGGTGDRQGVAPMPPEPSFNRPKNRKEKDAPARTEPTTTFRGSRVPADLAAGAERLLVVFCEATGRRLSLRTAQGKPTSALTQVIGAMLDRPETTVEEWEAGVRATVASPPEWVTGPVQPGHVFGGRASEWTLTATARTASGGGRRQDAPRTANAGDLSRFPDAAA